MRLWLACAAVLMMVPPALAAAPSASVLSVGDSAEVTADRLDYDASRELYEASGHVRIVSGSRRLSARWLVFSPLTKRGVASGDVVLSDGDQVLEARFLQFDVDTLEGVLYQGKIDLGEGNLRIAALEFVGTGEDRYTVFGAKLSTCRCPDDGREPWRLSAARSDIEVGGYGRSLNATFDVLGVPVMWFPWILYPVKTERSSGLLFPEISLGGRNGFGVGLPVFWAARPNLNLMFTPRWSQKRGFKGDFEVDTVYGTASRTRAQVAYADDRDVAEPTAVLGSGDQFGKHRWSVQLDHDQELPLAVRARADLRLSSDNQVPNDFDDLQGHSADRFLESTAFLSRHFGRDAGVGLVAGARMADDRQNPDDRDRDKLLLQRWPEAALRVLPAPAPVDALAFLVPSLDIDYVRFGAERRPGGVLGAPVLTSNGHFVDSGIDGLPNSLEDARPGVLSDDFDAVTNPSGSEGNGLFDEGEALADRGHRLVVHPRLAWPLRFFESVEMLPELGYQQTLYWSDAQGFEERGILTARNEVRMRARGPLDLPGLPALDHIIEPRLSWALVSPQSGSRQEQNPLFVPRTATPQRRLRHLALDNLVLDPSDRIGAANRIALAVSNRLALPGGAGKAARPLAEFLLSADYDFSKSRWGQLVFDGRSFAYRGFSTRLGVSYDLPDSRIDEARAALRVPLPFDAKATLSYRYLREAPRFFENFGTELDRFGGFRREFHSVNQIGFGATLPVGERWMLRYSQQRSLAPSLVLSNTATIEYTSRCNCWAAGVVLRESRDRGWLLSYKFTLLGFGQGLPIQFDGNAGALLSGGR